MSAIKRNLVSLLAAQAATWVVTLVSVTVVPNYLGEADFGRLSFAMAYVGFFTIILSLGTSLLLTREIAGDHSLIGSYVYNAAILKVGMTVVLSALALAVARLLGTTGDEFVLIVLSCIGMLFFGVGEVFASALAGLEQLARPAFFTVVQVYVANGVAIVVLAAGGGLIAFGTVFLLASTIPVVATGIMVWPRTRGHRHLDPKVWKWLIRAGIPLTMLAASNLLYGTIDIPILNYKAGGDEVGWYTLAQRWVGIPAFISTAVGAAYYPRLSALAKRKASDFAEQVNRAVLLVLLPSVPAAIGLGLVAHDLVETFYRGKFTESISVIQVLVFHIPLTVTDTILVMALLAANRQNRYVIIAAVAAVLNPIACFVVIPWTDHRWGNGALGAAGATVGTELFIMIGAIKLRTPGVLAASTIGRCARIIAAGLTMGIVVWLFRDLPFVVKIGLGVVTYPLALLVFRPVSFGEMRALMPRRDVALVAPGGEVADVLGDPDQPE